MWVNPLTERRCTRKSAYHGEPLAKKLAWRASLRARKPIVPYKCPDCGWWHIGHAFPEERAALQRQLDRVLIKRQNESRDKSDFLKRVRFTDLTVPAKPHIPRLPLTGKKIQAVVSTRVHYPVTKVITKPAAAQFSVKSGNEPKVPGPPAKVYDVTVGKRFGTLTVVEAPPVGRCIVQCDCGERCARKRAVVFRADPGGTCQECSDTAHWLANFFFAETGFMLPSEMFIHEAAAFSVQHQRTTNQRS